MSEIVRNEEVDGQELDLLEIAKLFLRNIWTILLVATVTCAMMLAYTVFFVTPKYQATASVYVNSSSISVGQTNFSISSTELSTSSRLVSTYVYILNTRETMEQVIKEAGLRYSYTQLLGMISTKAIENTSIFTITVSSPSPTEAEKIANTIVSVLPDRIAEVVDGSTVRVASYAIVPAHRSSPDYMVQALIGFLAGAVICCAVIFVVDYFGKRNNVTVDSVDMLKARYPQIAVLTVIPDMRYGNRGNHYYSSYYGKEGGKAKDGK